MELNAIPCVMVLWVIAETRVPAMDLIMEFHVKIISILSLPNKCATEKTIVCTGRTKWDVQ